MCSQKERVGTCLEGFSAELSIKEAVNLRMTFAR